MTKSPQPFIVTSSWYTGLPDTYARIGVSRGRPRGQSGFRMFSALAPGEWWNRVSVTEYRELYFQQLAKLDPASVLLNLQTIAGDRIPALLCFESLEDDDAWCHRGYIAAWFSDALNLNVYEYGFPSNTVGWSHPKIPRTFRKDSDHL